MSDGRQVAIRALVEPVATWTPERDDPGGEFTYIDLSAVEQEAKTITGARQIACAGAPSRARQLVRADDVLISTVRPNLNAVARVPRDLDGATASTGFCVLRPQTERLLGGYLFHWVRSPLFVGEMVRLATGASYPAVSDRIVLDSNLPLPPLPEQRRIAALLDKADALRAKRRASLARLDTLAQAVFLDMFGDPATNPKGWPRIGLRELLAKIDSGWSPKCLDRPVIGEEWGILKLGAVTWCEYDPMANKALPPDVEPDASIEVKRGDLLFARKNTYELVAAAALVRETPPRLLMSDLIFRLRLRPDAQVDATFLHQLLIYPTKRREIQKLASGSSGSMPNISKARLETTPIEVPPFPMQRDFAQKVAAVETLRAAHRESLSELDALFASLQNRSFRSELT